MPASIFLDTNVLVYAISGAGEDLEKATKAKRIIQEETFCVSTQVLGEFYSVAVSPRRPSPLSHNEAVAWIQFWKRFDVFEITTAHVDLALETAGGCKIGYYDALIISAARLAGCDKIYSEDLNDGQDYGGIKVTNPFV